jgi:hypothetical protein
MQKDKMKGKIEEEKQKKREEKQKRIETAIRYIGRLVILAAGSHLSLILISLEPKSLYYVDYYIII